MPHAEELVTHAARRPPEVRRAVRGRHWSPVRRPARFAGMALALVGAVALGLGGWASLAPAADGPPQTREFTLTAEEIAWELQPGTPIRAWAYNGQVPGPEIRVREGDRVRITLVNKLPLGTTIHWHGVNVPPAMDGPAGLNQTPVEPGQSFTYDFVATPAGTRWYHSHTDVATQVALGLYGAFIVEPKRGGPRYDRDDTYILAEWDNELTPDVATGKSPRGPRDAALRGGALGADEFLMDGHTNEAIPPILVKEGDTVLIRLINAGSLAHPFHIHGHSFRIVATDGNPVPEAAQLTKDTVLIAPCERYDLAFDANNPGVWMVHCHIEKHAANGMMTVIQYEGYAPTGPLKEFWGKTPPAGSDPGPGMNGMSGMHGEHAGSDPAATTGAAVATAAVPPTAISAADAESGGVARLSMLDDRFQPNILTVKVGTTVTWTNKGADWHSVAGFDGSFESGQVSPEETFSHKFTEPGTYPFLCRHHGRQGMIGRVIVTA
ncbi:MAG: multicopper oxidase domain-containing protein [Thermomicrobiales bacterium]